MIKRTFVAMLASLPLVAAVAPARSAEPKPTIVLVHGAFADSSSWNGVAAQLQRDGYHTVAAPNTLRSPRRDAAVVAALVRSIKGPVVLVGHSYGGTVISAAANEAPNVSSLVFVAAFAPDAGETSLGLTGKFPGATLGAALLPPVDDGAGGQDLYIDPAKFPAQFAADVPKAQASLMGVGQRPIAKAALEEPSGAPAWRKLPSRWIYGSDDRNIPAAAMAFMAKRSGSKETVVIPGASHVVMVSHPSEVARVIEDAATHP